ncbi:MAG: sodium ion-translocating decarboxylase subunit beta, partial [Oscillospiraceae bacterium]|nr:sodium ion-translocating decarboxylase subunit beta [Oscillospiraceae bacterium]
MLEIFLDTLKEIWNTSGISAIFMGDNWKNLIMIAISFGFMYLAIVKQFEPHLLLPIAFGMFLTNLPVVNISDAIYHPELFDYVYEYDAAGNVIDHYIDYGRILKEGGLLDILYI